MEQQKKKGKKKWIVLGVIAAIIILFIVLVEVNSCKQKHKYDINVGVEADEDNYKNWNGTYVGFIEEDNDVQTFKDAKVKVDDGYISIDFASYKADGTTSNDTVEGNYTESEDGKAIYVVNSINVYELRKMGSDYTLSEKNKDLDDTYEKFDLKKGGELPTHVFTKKAPETTVKADKPKKASKPKKAKKKKKSSSGVSASFKETMDDYEDFIDDYVAFMKKYNKASSTDRAGMMSDYSEMLSEYSDLSQEMSNMETDLSGDDLAYYTKVMARCSKKLASVSQ